MGMLPLKPELKRLGPWIPEEQKYPTPFRQGQLRYRGCDGGHSGHTAGSVRFLAVLF